MVWLFWNEGSRRGTPRMKYCWKVKPGSEGRPWNNAFHPFADPTLDRDRDADQVNPPFSLIFIATKGRFRDLKILFNLEIIPLRNGDVLSIGTGTSGKPALPSCYHRVPQVVVFSASPEGSAPFGTPSPVMPSTPRDKRDAHEIMHFFSLQDLQATGRQQGSVQANCIPLFLLPIKADFRL